MPEERAEVMWAGSQLAASGEDPAHRRRRQGMGASPGPRDPILQAGEALFPVPPDPLVDGGPGDPHHLGCSSDRPAFGYPFHEQPSAERGQLGTTMRHEEPPFRVGTLSAPHREGRLFDVNNLRGNYS